MYPLPKRSGLSLKPQHFENILENQPDIGFFEVHPENYMTPGGNHREYLRRIAERYPLSMHGVGMSLGSANGVDDEHLQALAKLAEEFQPVQISEHLSWSHWNEIYLNDLLPLPYTRESLALVTNNIDKVQNRLKTTILIENPSTYLCFDNNDFSEPEFLNTVCKQSGCGLLLDINNIAVSAFNHGTSASDYLNNIDATHIGEIHLAGHTEKPLIDDKTIRIDDHGSEVSQEVWALLQKLLQQTLQAYPILIEWDTDVPDFSLLLQQALKAETLLQDANASATQARSVAK